MLCHIYVVGSCIVVSVVLIIAMLCLVNCELFLKALFTCVFQVELIKVSTLRGPCFACNKVQLEAMSSENIPRFTRSQAARVNRNMEDEVAPEDSISQASVRTSVSSSHSSHSRSKEQLELDISTLAIKMQSQQRRARLEKEKLDVEKKKLDIELELEKNNLQEEMDLAINEKESLEASEQNKEILDDCCTYLGSGRVDLDGKKTCRMYIRPDKNKIEPEEKYCTSSTYKHSGKGSQAPVGYDI